MCAVITSVVLGFMYFAGKPMVDVGEQFMIALKNGDTQAAFALCAPVYQAQLGSPDSLQSQLATNGLQPVSWTLNVYNNSQNDQGILTGSVTLSDNSSGTVQISMQNISGQWLITGVQIQ